mmetsp:Transcript_4655/g.17515  ORF Transcript_4655/g.17515 Transcript_4655/m.17515 type:complete len:284 (+) Transcript_4655:795-1646(+)
MSVQLQVRHDGLLVRFRQLLQVESIGLAVPAVDHHAGIADALHLWPLRVQSFSAWFLFVRLHLHLHLHLLLSLVDGRTVHNVGALSIELGFFVQREHAVEPIQGRFGSIQIILATSKALQPFLLLQSQFGEVPRQACLDLVLHGLQQLAHGVAGALLGLLVEEVLVGEVGVGVEAHLATHRLRTGGEELEATFDRPQSLLEESLGDLLGFVPPPICLDDDGCIGGPLHLQVIDELILLFDFCHMRKNKPDVVNVLLDQLLSLLIEKIALPHRVATPPPLNFGS